MCVFLLSSTSLPLRSLSLTSSFAQAVIIYLYQSVWAHGPISHVILAAMQQILHIGARVLQTYQPSPSMAPAPPTANGTPDGATPSGAARPYPQVPLPTAATTTAFAESLSTSTDEGGAGSSVSASTMANLFSPLARAIPFFLAGTCALLPSERDICLRGLQACGGLRGYQDDIAALRRIWELQNEKGWLRDWRAVIEEEKLAVAFM